MQDPWQAYSDALTPVLFHAWGKPLMPLTLGHLATLRALSHPIIEGGRTWSDGDVALAVMAGRMGGTQAMAMLSDSSIEDKAKAFAKANRKQSPATAQRAIRHWWEHYLAAPQKWHDAKPKEPRAPIEWILAWKLAGNRYPGAQRMSEIWNLPCNVAFCMATVEGVLNGDDSPMTQKEAKIVEVLRRKKAQA